MIAGAARGAGRCAATACRTGARRGRQLVSNEHIFWWDETSAAYCATYCGGPTGGRWFIVELEYPEEGAVSPPFLCLDDALKWARSGMREVTEEQLDALYEASNS